MESTATTTEQPTVRFLILEELKNLSNAHGTLFVGVRDGPRKVT